MKSLCKLN